MKLNFEAVIVCMAGLNLSWKSLRCESDRSTTVQSFAVNQRVGGQSEAERDSLGFPLICPGCHSGAPLSKPSAADENDGVSFIRVALRRKHSPLFCALFMGGMF